MNSDTEVGTTSTTSPERRTATFLNSCLHDEAKEDVLDFSELLLTGAVGDHDGVEDAIRITAGAESKMTSGNAFEQRSSTTADQPVVESSKGDSNNRLCSDCSDEFLGSVLNENSLSAEANADGCGDGNSTDSKLLMTSWKIFLYDIYIVFSDFVVVGDHLFIGAWFVHLFWKLLFATVASTRSFQIRSMKYLDLQLSNNYQQWTTKFQI